MTPETDLGAMARALKSCSQDGIGLGLWPLLEDGEGYWPSVGNAALFARRALDVLEFARHADLRISTLAIDLEPALAFKRAVLGGPLPGRLSRLTRARAAALTPSGQEQWQDSQRIYSQLVSSLEERGIESFAIAVPPVMLDIAGGTDAWQRIFSVPVMGPGFATVSPMIYSSILRQALPGNSARLARALVLEASRHAARAPVSTCVSLGVVGPAADGGTGKLGDERCYEGPEDLAVDVGLVRSAGLDDLALFSLEGVLGRERPEEWLAVFAGDGAPPSKKVGDRAARSLAHMGTLALSTVSRRLPI